MSGGRMFGSTISGSDSSSSVVVVVDEIKCKIFAAEDVTRNLEWAEINGVRRLIKEEWHSAKISLEVLTDVKIVRDFVYQTADPFDLVEINDSLQVV